MYINKREYGVGTYVVQSGPWGLFHSAKALCSDGKLRTTSRISTIADTFFSVPAAVVVYDGKGGRKTVSGYITFETLGGLSTEFDGDPTTVKFVAYTYGKNHDALPRGTWRGKLDFETYTAEACSDCIMLAANGEMPDGVLEHEPLNRLQDGYSLIVPEGDPHFSWRTCETCGGLAGNRWDCTIMSNERVFVQDGE